MISGPTGSGKTTTLYATLKLLNQTTRNILTIEDPIEYTLEGINQVQLRENIGLDFASALRTFLRQDPDTIMVGEIRDKANRFDGYSRIIDGTLSNVNYSYEFSLGHYFEIGRYGNSKLFDCRYVKCCGCSTLSSFAL